MYTTRWRASNRIRSLLTGLLVAGGTVATMASPASALTLGTTANAAGPNGVACAANTLYFPQVGAPSAAVMPSSSAGLLTSWSYNATDAPASKSVSLVVLRPTGFGYTATGVDTEAVPAQATPGVVTFTLGSPLKIAPNDSIGLYSADGTGDCTGETSAVFNTKILSGPGQPSVGGAYTPLQSFQGDVNLSAEVTQTSDLAITGEATPAAVPVGDDSTLILPVSDRDGQSGPASFTAAVPAGLHAVAAVVSGGACVVNAALVTCGLTLRSGGTPPSLVVVVAADAPGTYGVTSTIDGGFAEQTPADNAATTTITVSPRPAQAAPTITTVPGPVIGSVPVCTTVAVNGLSVSLAKRVLIALHCQPTTGKAKTSKTVKKGLVITTSPGPGKTLANGANVSLIPSSGPAKKKTSKKKKS